MDEERAQRRAGGGRIEQWLIRQCLRVFALRLEACGQSRLGRCRLLVSVASSGP